MFEFGSFFNDVQMRHPACSYLEGNKLEKCLSIEVAE